MFRAVRVASSILALLAIATTARAQDDVLLPSEEAGLDDEGPARLAPPIAPRVAVVLLPGGPDVDPAMTDALTELLIAGVAARGEGFQIVGKEELQAQLERDDAETARCIESAACLGRVGALLDVREIIAGTLALRADASGAPAWAFDLHRIDVRDGEQLGRVFREVSGDLDALLRALEESIPELYARRVQPGRLVVRATVQGAAVTLDGAAIGVFDGAPLRRETVEPGTHLLRVEAAGFRAFERSVEVEEGATLMIDAVLERAGSWTPSPLVWVGGAIALASATAGIAFGVASQAEPSDDVSMRDVVEQFYPARDAEAIAANVLFGIAGAGAVAVAVGLAMSGIDDAPRERASAWVAPVEGGAAAGVAGRF
ncbi:PEGA domain-containing protein [Sandaracinus amylolyticus]|uniref:PEGA domain-containing protein n=1 Tax=Sandaracinus amylolyticus TaxID=927083 RepID=UPI00069CCE23|nr:PEGA domain-containing protein [Sandaracinus amylolyticus]